MGKRRVITIVDYGVGNISSLVNMLEHLEIESETSRSPKKIANAQSLVLPGVGAFDKAMSTLRSSQLVEALNEAVLSRHTPILGVCLGMQLFARTSEEGNEPGLGWLRADVKRIRVPNGSDLKVPNIGWIEVRPTCRSQLFDSAPRGERYYFVHSYYVHCDDLGDVAAVIDYGSSLCCAVSVGNIHGVQFHPEKSHRFGMRLLKTFATLE